MIFHVRIFQRSRQIKLGPVATQPMLEPIAHVAVPGSTMGAMDSSRTCTRTCARPRPSNLQVERTKQSSRAA
jgi:hypothetical protein